MALDRVAELSKRLLHLTELLEDAHDTHIWDADDVDQMKDHGRECEYCKATRDARAELNAPTYYVDARRWFDSRAGNTYHSVEVTFPDGSKKVAEMVYGYGDSYRQTAFELITGLSYSDNGRPRCDWRHYEENRMYVTFYCQDVTRKRDLHHAG